MNAGIFDQPQIKRVIRWRWELISGGLLLGFASCMAWAQKIVIDRTWGQVIFAFELQFAR